VSLSFYILCHSLSGGLQRDQHMALIYSEFFMLHANYVGPGGNEVGKNKKGSTMDKTIHSVDTSNNSKFGCMNYCYI
jgi:hypothetical protein